MKVFLGGIAAAFLGIIGIFVFFGPFLQLLAGAVPLMLLLGGAMAAYLGYDEVKDQLPFGKKQEAEETPAPAPEETSKYKEEAEKYKQEVEKLKAELDKTKTEATS
ncbi:MAG: hypothetical protein SWC40_12125 [Thermodesulfobacteriota bacterium]|nr:hypothetical protein [Thermodesulfobacteriota bacterium]